jgi:3-hydroxyisobutyrate dehydrogenase
MDSFEYKNVGFIGLGAMGGPMVGHLAEKLPKETRIYIFDVVESLLDDFCAKYPNRAFKARNAREVAEKSVWTCLSRVRTLAN